MLTSEQVVSLLQDRNLIKVASASEVSYHKVRRAYQGYPMTADTLEKLSDYLEKQELKPSAK